MNKLPKHSSITLSVFSLPILLALLVIAGLGAKTLLIDTGFVQNTAVLSDEDENDSGGDDNDEDEDSDDNNNDSEDENKGEDNDESGDDDNDSNDSKESSKNTTGKSSQDDSEDSDDDEIEFEDDNNEGPEDELEDSEETAEVTTVTNDDGTITKTFKKTDGDEIKTKIVTYNTSGKIISETELKEDGSEDKSEIKVISTVTNSDGTITKTFTKTEGSKVETRTLTYNQNGKLIKKARLNADGSIREEEMINDDEDDSDDSSEIEDESEDEFELTFRPGVGGSVDPTLSRIIKAKLKQEVETEDGLGDSVNKVELEVKTAQGTIKYEGTALKDEKLFGIFGIEIPVDIVVDPITGKVVSVNQSFWTKILDFFSL